MRSASTDSERKPVEAEEAGGEEEGDNAPGDQAVEGNQLAFHKQVETYINEYVKKKYCEQQRNWQQMQKTMIKHTKRTLKIITAVLSIWVPGLVKLISLLSTDAVCTS